MKSFDTVVIGAGPGGYPCAIRAAQLGQKVAIIEKEYWGGVCLNVGCIPSKAIIYASSTYHKVKHEGDEMGIIAPNIKPDAKKLQAWKSEVVKKISGGVATLLKMNKVETIKGSAVFKDAKTLEVTTEGGQKETVTAKNIVIATGGRPIDIPILPCNGKNILNSTHALALSEVPEKFVVIGGGFIGLEIGIAFAKLGSKVTVVEGLPQVLASVDKELVQVVEKKCKKLGMEILTNTKAIGLKEKDPAKSALLHLDVEGPNGEKKSLEATHILVSVGRRPNSDGLGLEKIGVKMDPRGNILADQQSKTNVPGVWAIGDVAGAPQLAHRATMDGILAAAAIGGQRSFKDYKCIPWAVFSDPEIAVVGLTEKEAQEKGLKFRVGKFPFAALGRAVSMNEPEGLIKVVIQEGTDVVLGVHIVGPEASNLIAEAALAIEMGACAEDIIRTIHTHPTLPEGMPEALESAYGEAIHIYRPLRGGAHGSAGQPEQRA